MYKKALLLFTIILLTGCVERGYNLTVNTTTNTVTAIKSVDTRTKETSTTKTDIEKMSSAVTKEQKKHTPTVKKQISQKKKPITEEKKVTTKKIEKSENPEIERKDLADKLAKEKEKNRIAAEKDRSILAQKVAAQKEAAEKKLQALVALKQSKEKKKALEEKLVQEKAARERKEKADKLALERKIAKEQKIQEQKEKEQKAALERKLAKEQKIQAQKEKEQKASQERKLTQEKKIQEADKRAENITKEKASQALKLAEEKKVPLATTESLIFKPSQQTYHKFGTSEIHGHVVYLNATGKEINLINTKIYLVPKSTKTDYWYTNYYLKNKESSNISKSVVNYMNATHLNLEKNFAFYGLAPGTYYVIIESSYPKNTGKNKKVYIAKKINVEKYKKIMTVFSKKL